MYRVKSDDSAKPVFVSAGLRDKYGVSDLHVDVNIVENDVLDLEKFKATRPDIAGEQAEFMLEDGKYLCGVEVEKMSKSKFNVVNPDDIVERYGAGHAAAVRNVPWSVGTSQALEHQRHRRHLPLHP